MFGDLESRTVTGGSTNSVSAKKYCDVIEKLPQAKSAFLGSLVRSVSQGEQIPAFLKQYRIGVRT